ncbi:site-specific recombinase, phage integrase famil y protein [Novosphingobium sp. PY1]|nr:site-specific recombinase, phage integrase family protein [Novosphingobium sp. PY1]GFM31255.1 site-specific recombinase, phage integrase famil y protein [Novosphingobium sp. PY1]
MGNLTLLKAKNAKPGRHSDGKGLMLLVKPSGARSWVLRVQHKGTRHEIGLGSIDDLSLAEARDKAAELRRIVRQGGNARAFRDKVDPVIPTFAEAVGKAHAALLSGWSDKTGDAFKRSLEEHAVPIIGARRVDEIGAEHVVSALAPIWVSKPQQARKIRVRILQVLGFAKGRGWRSSPLPDPLDITRALPKQPRGRNFAAMPYSALPSFVSDQLKAKDSSARLALLFTILTAARSGEVRWASWQDIDLRARTWTRSAELMKSRQPHVVTLNAAALAILERAATHFGNDALVFPSSNSRKPLSDMALSKMLRDAGRPETVHGFRSTFRDWAAEKMPRVPSMVAEMALAHSVGNATEQAYLRSDLRQLRFQLMDAWGTFVAPSISRAVE